MPLYWDDKRKQKLFVPDDKIEEFKKQVEENGDIGIVSAYGSFYHNGKKVQLPLGKLNEWTAGMSEFGKPVYSKPPKKQDDPKQNFFTEGEWNALSEVERLGRNPKQIQGYKAYQEKYGGRELLPESMKLGTTGRIVGEAIGNKVTPLQNPADLPTGFGFRAKEMLNNAANVVPDKLNEWTDIVTNARMSATLQPSKPDPVQPAQPQAPMPGQVPTGPRPAQVVQPQAQPQIQTPRTLMKQRSLPMSVSVGVGKGLASSGVQTAGGVLDFLGNRIADLFTTEPGIDATKYEKLRKEGIPNEEAAKQATVVSPYNEKLRAAMSKPGKKIFEKGEEISKMYEEAFPTGKVLEEPRLLVTPQYWAEGIPNALTSIFLAYAGGKILPGKGTLPMSIAGATMEAAPMYEEMVKNKMGEKEAALKSMAFGIVVSKLEKTSLDKMFGLKAGKQLLKRALSSAFTEAATEWAENPAQAAIQHLEKLGTKPTEYMKDVVRASIQGIEVMPSSFAVGLLGGGSGVTMKKDGQALGKEVPIIQAKESDNAAVATRPVDEGVRTPAGDGENQEEKPRQVSGETGQIKEEVSAGSSQENAGDVKKPSFSTETERDRHGLVEKGEPGMAEEASRVPDTIAIVSRDQDGKINGSLAIQTNKKGEAEGVDIVVREDSRHKKIGQNLVKHAESLGLDPVKAVQLYTGKNKQSKKGDGDGELFWASQIARRKQEAQDAQGRAEAEEATTLAPPPTTPAKQATLEGGKASETVVGKRVRIGKTPRTAKVISDEGEGYFHIKDEKSGELIKNARLDEDFTVIKEKSAPAKKSAGETIKELQAELGTLNHPAPSRLKTKGELKAAIKRFRHEFESKKAMVAKAGEPVRGETPPVKTAPETAKIPGEVIGELALPKLSQAIEGTKLAKSPTVSLEEVESLANEYRKTGRIAFVYPKKKRVSLNGGASMTFEDAKKAMSSSIPSPETAKVTKDFYNLDGTISNPKWVKAEGAKPISVKGWEEFPGLFIRQAKNPNGIKGSYYIVEPKTGLAIGKGRIRKDAIESAEKSMETHGKEKIREWVDAAIKETPAKPEATTAKPEEKQQPDLFVAKPTEVKVGETTPEQAGYKSQEEAQMAYKKEGLAESGETFAEFLYRKFCI